MEEEEGASAGQKDPSWLGAKGCRGNVVQIFFSSTTRRFVISERSRLVLT